VELNNSADGGTQGATVSVANSGGASGNAWNSVVGTPTITFDNTHAIGPLAYRVAGAASAQQMAWSFTAIIEMWGRIYLWSNANPSASTGIVRPTIGGAQAARIRLDADSRLTLADAGNAAEVTTANPVPTGQWVRVEWRIQFVASGAAVALRTYNGADSTAPTENLSGTAAGIGAGCDGCQFGSFNSTTWAGWFDAIQINDTGFPGPLMRPRGAVLAPPRAAVQRAATW
jgi:hypothetical protein